MVQWERFGQLKTEVSLAFVNPLDSIIRVMTVLCIGGPGKKSPYRDLLLWYPVW